MLYVKPKRENLIVYSCNCRTPNGNRCKKDRMITNKEKYLVVDEFISMGLATHGEKCYELRDNKGYSYYVMARDVEIVD